MSKTVLYCAIKNLLEQNSFLTHADIAQELKKDKAIISGYLEAMTDYGEILVKRAGNSKLYFIDPKK